MPTTQRGELGGQWEAYKQQLFMEELQGLELINLKMIFFLSLSHEKAIRRSCSLLPVDEDSVDWCLHCHCSRCASTLSLWFIFSQLVFLLSYAVIHVTWNPWVSFVKSSSLRNGIRNQSVLFFPFLSPPSEGMSQFTVWRQLCVLSQDKPVVVSLKASGSGYSDFKTF